jgi:ribose transport system permease protein
VAPAPQPQSSPGRQWLAGLLRASEASVLLVIVALWLYMAASGRLPTFASEYNQENLKRSISMQSIVAVGELLVILTGGIDLSVGSLIAFDGMLLATLGSRWADAGMPIMQATLLSMLVVLLFSGFLGLVHSSLIHFLRLPPFVVTLASMSMLRSGALLLNNAVPIPIERFELITRLGNKKLFIAGTPYGEPIVMVILIVIAAATIATLGFTQIGRHVYSVGSNEEASHLSGVNVFKVRAFVYGSCSFLAGVAAILYAGYGGQGDPSSGVMFELNAISAAVIGGAVLTGGRGSVIGTILGATLLESILSMINFTLSNPTLWRGMVVGGVLLSAVIFNQLRLRGRSRH